ncbi:MAG: SH3 domain-containing protein [Lachnospiraceae bacterium]|nr:SH3 domain-containing protein [Lachnospiraceae bacterium]
MKQIKQKMIPIIIAVVLIILIVIIGLFSGIMEKYSYSDERMDLNEYFQVYTEKELSILWEDDFLEEKGIVQNGTCYLPLDMVQAYLNSRFYFDAGENLLIYTTPTEIIRAYAGENVYAVDGVEFPIDYQAALVEEEIPYIAVDFVKLYANFYYEVFQEPNRIEIYKESATVTVADIKKNAKIRYQGGIKSPILEDLQKGDTVTVLETMEKWSKVKTADSVIGYVENKRLTDERDFDRTVALTVEEPVYTSLNKDYPINLVWHMVTNPVANGNVEGLLANTKAINTISPTWFALSDNEGNFTSLADKSYVDFMHQRGIEVWALIDNFTGRIEGEAVNTKEILTSTTKRTYLIQNLMEQILANGIDGINVDFEQVPREAGEDYIQFLRELSIVCRRNGVVLSVDNYVPTEYTAYYNRKEQGMLADYIIIMGYDEHYSSSDIGSIASINYVENGIKNTLEEVPKEKVINAIPFYTGIWATTSGTTTVDKVSMSYGESFMTENGGTANWDEVTCQNYTTFQVDDTIYQIWLEDEESIQTKLNVMKNYDIAGVAGWRLGLEKPEVWELIEAYLQ